MGNFSWQFGFRLFDKVLSIGRVLRLEVNEFKDMMNSIFCGGVIDLRYMFNSLSDFHSKKLKDVANFMEVQLDTGLVMIACSP